MLEHTFTTWRPRLLRFCAQWLRNPHDAEEVVQDVFTRLAARPHAYDLSADPGVLLFRIARNRCADLRRRPRPVTSEGPEPAAPAAADPALDEAVAALPAAEREALLLTTVEGLGYREVAAILGCSLGSVANLRYAAINTLRQRLAP